LGTPALADIDPLSGIDFVRIGAPGNAPWMGDGTPGDRAIGRGSVNHEYSIGRYEVTTAQWTEFFNAAYDRPRSDWLPHLTPPTFWGAVPTTPNTPGGLRWSVPAGNGMRPVGNISWRMAAMYCNWLCNNKSTSREAFLNGAYDVSTFGYNGTVFTDQQTHNPGARYWIPTWDEHLKASHYDPNLNDGQGGWWLYNTSSDTRPAYGPPGVHVRTTGLPGPDPDGPLSQANGLWDTPNFPGYDPFSIPLGAYPDVQSPWGLFDTAGGTAEWSEEVLLTNGQFPTARLFDGSAWAGDGTFADLVNHSGGDAPSFSFYDLGFRVASAVPSPGSSALGVGLLLILNQRRRRK
jgi:formylglycine-generating enzyme required for sulfatase activity